MPKLSGFNILKFIENRQDLKEKYKGKIVVITALANNYQITELHKYSSVLDIIFKPLDISKIKYILDLVF